MTSIEWTDETWNPTTGCDRVSPGCDNCYALPMARRLKAMGSAKYQRDGDPRTSGPGFGVSVHEDALNIPLRWRKPRKVFVNSTSDLFHDQVPDEFIGRVFETMSCAPRHTFQILTKRHSRMRSLLQRWTRCGETGCECPGAQRVSEPPLCTAPVDTRLGLWPLRNVWLGVSVEDRKRAVLRIPALVDTPAAVRFLSCEPLLGPVYLDAWLWPNRGLHWVIVGGESGPGARPMELDWATDLVEQCRDARVPVFVKQLGSAYGSHKGGDMESWPPELRVREYPRVAGTS